MSSRTKIYEEINDRIVASMEKGVIPWRKPWVVPTGALSHTHGRPYSLLNQFMLQLDADIKGLESSTEYLTFNQVKAEGGSVKKGEKSSMVVFWSMYKKTVTNAAGEEKEEQFPILRNYRVFEVSQCENIKRKYASFESTSTLKPIEKAERIVRAYFDKQTCKLQVGSSSQAYYMPAIDMVNVPRLEQYYEAEEYYSTIFHEMIHSTAHQDRLSREGFGDHGAEQYAKEELVAELGAAYLCNLCGISTEKCFDNSVAYLQGWSKRLKDDKYLFVSAASKAEKAVDFIMACLDDTSLAVAQAEEIRCNENQEF